jgi:hypothetical protein
LWIGYLFSPGNNGVASNELFAGLRDRMKAPLVVRSSPERPRTAAARERVACGDCTSRTLPMMSNP